MDQFNACKLFRTGPLLLPESELWLPLTQIHRAQANADPPVQLLPSRFSLMSGRAAGEMGRGDSKLVVVWEYSGGKEQRLGTPHWHVLRGHGCEKAGDRAQEGENRKGTGNA